MKRHKAAGLSGLVAEMIQPTGGYWNPVDIRESFLSLDLFSLKLKNILWPVTGAIAPPLWTRH